jgi:hypothetical protein
MDNDTSLDEFPSPGETMNGIKIERKKTEGADAGRTPIECTSAQAVISLKTA